MIAVGSLDETEYIFMKSLMPTLWVNGITEEVRSNTYSTELEIELGREK